MSRIWSTVDIGKRALANAQTGLQTVAHNVANKSTEGYSRQRVEFEAAEPTSKGLLQIGSGARPSAISRINDVHLEKQLQKEGAEFSYHEARSAALGRVEQVYNEQLNKGLNRYSAEFFNSFRELANNPESLATRSNVKETAQYLAKDFKRVNSQLNEIEADIDFQMAGHLGEVNQLTEEIAKLNEKVRLVEMSGGHSNDERDRRDLLVKKLGEKINIKANENREGIVNISAGDTALLVSGFSAQKLEYHMVPAADRKGPTFEIYYKSSEKATPMLVTQQMRGGAIGGLLQVRNETIKDLSERLDEMAYTFATEVNAAHAEGYTRSGTKGVNFFDIPDQVLGAADRIEVSEDIRRDVGNIAAAGAPDSPADNRIAHVISQLQYKGVFGEGGTSTIDDYYSAMVADVGINAQRANSSRDSQKDIVSQLKNIRESISGVSLDEEATKMIEFQKAFDASARLIRTADEMLDTVINLKKY